MKKPPLETGMSLVGVKAGGAHLSLLCCVTPQAEGVTGAP